MPGLVEETASVNSGAEEAIHVACVLRAEVRSEIDAALKVNHTSIVGNKDRVSKAEIDAETDHIVGQMIAIVRARAQIGVQVLKPHAHIGIEPVFDSGAGHPT